MGSIISSSCEQAIAFKTVDDCSSAKQAMPLITHALRNDPSHPHNYSSKFAPHHRHRRRNDHHNDCPVAVAKVVLRGDSSVRKSSILLGLAAAAADDHPPSPPSSPSASNDTYISPPPWDNGLSIGTAFASQRISLRENNDCSHSGMRFEVWDTAAQQRFAQSASLACLGASAVVFIYDITRATTFFKVQQWVQELFEHRNLDRGSNLVLALVGNKADMKGTLPGKEESVNTATAHSFAKRHGMIFMEMSTEAQPDHIKALFVEIGKRLLKPMES